MTNNNAFDENRQNSFINNNQIPDPSPVSDKLSEKVNILANIIVILGESLSTVALALSYEERRQEELRVSEGQTNLNNNINNIQQQLNYISKDLEQIKRLLKQK